MSTTWSAFAITAPGIAPVTAAELAALGIPHEPPTPDGVAFAADFRTIALVNLWLRTASRVIVRLGEFKAQGFADLEKGASKLPWGKVLLPGQAIAVRVTCRKSRLYHSDAVAERVVRQISKFFGVDAPVVRLTDSDEEDAPTDEAQRILVRIVNDVCTVSADSSGELLHRRGYRQAVAKAPLRETVAAACLLATDYDGSQAFIDPMCGSGTFPIEAAMIARQQAPGRARPFAFEHWPGADRDVLPALRRATKAAGVDVADLPIIGSDRDPGAIRMSIANAERAGVEGMVRFEQKTLEDIEPPTEFGAWCSNAPYGRRVGNSDALTGLFVQIGKLARGPFSEWRVALLLAEQSHVKALQSPTTEILKTRVGGIQVGLYGIEG
ncbi:MAG: class I SAM-dependent RNA methyltransferase [Polaromonas sp.]|nr:class I SAM-dependent RNA methyltransferase [Gemmatimonadaceae bacterium]